MIDIYDEIDYIKNILRDGLSPKWERDIRLLVRYYKTQDYKKSQAKAKILKKCEAANENHVFAYNPIRDYKRLNSIIDQSWKDTTGLRQIKQVSFTREVLDWFLSLEDSIILTDEQVANFKKTRPKIVIKNNKALNLNRVKYLFTLFIWTQIQSNYLDRPDVLYLGNNNKRFKEDANLPSSFNLMNERDYLFDLGLIDVNFSLGIHPKFLDYDVFKIPATKDNRVELSVGKQELSELRTSNFNTITRLDGDLYNPGLWLEKEKYGLFVCKECGKVTPHYGDGKNEYKRVFCKECASKQRASKKKYNIKYCIDCNKPLGDYSTIPHKQIRCDECQALNRQIKRQEYNSRYYIKQRVESEVKVC